MTFIKNNMKMIYFSKTTYLILAIVISIITCFAFSDAKNCYLIYQNDIFLWVVVILASITIHRRFVYSISYNILVRMTNKKKYIVYNCLTLLLSTIIICFFIYSIAFVIQIITNHKIIYFEKIIFCLFRYILVLFFAQYIIFLLMLMIPKIQRNNNIIYPMPILLFFIVTLPKEFLYSTYHIYIPALDFGSGGSLIVNKENLFSSIFCMNIHLISYIICLILISLNFLVDKMELLENNENYES